MVSFGKMFVKSISKLNIFMIFFFYIIIFICSGQIPQVFTIRNLKKQVIFTKTTRLRNFIFGKDIYKCVQTLPESFSGLFDVMSDEDFASLDLPNFDLVSGLSLLVSFGSEQQNDWLQSGLILINLIVSRLFVYVYKRILSVKC